MKACRSRDLVIGCKKSISQYLKLKQVNDQRALFVAENLPKLFYRYLQICFRAANVQASRDHLR
jgi:hypothetical protein